MTTQTDAPNPTVVHDAASVLVLEAQTQVILSIVAELARRLEFPGLVARCSSSSFEVETRNIVAKLLLKLASENPEMVKPIYARLKVLHLAPEDPHGRFS